MPHPIDSTSSLFSGNSTFIEELYERYLQNPASVDASWRDFFRDSTNGAASAQRSASWARVKSQVIGVKEEDPVAAKGDKKNQTPQQVRGDRDENYKDGNLYYFVRSFPCHPAFIAGSS